MKDRKSNEKLESRYRGLCARLLKSGLVLQGTITERTIVRPAGKNFDHPKTYGPYYQWTFKKAGKTVTVNLTAQQAKLYQKAIDNNSKLERTLKQMRELSEEVLQAQTEGVKKRKARK